MRNLLISCAIAALALPAAANAQAIIDNGTVQLGVDVAGNLNIGGGTPSSQTGTTNVGVRDLATSREATADGCLCEGWGVAAGGSTVYANNDAGSSFTGVSFASTASTATSVVTSTDGAITVTHAFTPSASANLYQVDVTITNTSGADFAGSTLYRRTMDWDIDPTVFSEFVTIDGTTGATNVLAATNDGFCSSDPTDPCGTIGGFSGDFVDAGPFDHGANFDFTFGPLLAGASQTLTVFYGGAPSEGAALAALALVGAEVYSWGQSSLDMTGGEYTTFIFAFKGVGGDPVVVPEPSTWAMMIIGFGAAGSMIRRRRRSLAHA